MSEISLIHVRTIHSHPSLSGPSICHPYLDHPYVILIWTIYIITMFKTPIPEAFVSSINDWTVYVWTYISQLYMSRSSEYFVSGPSLSIHLCRHYRLGHPYVCHPWSGHRSGWSLSELSHQMHPFFDSSYIFHPCLGHPYPNHPHLDHLKVIYFKPFQWNELTEQQTFSL